MGIPSFYKWLSQRYPLCIAEAVDEAPVSDDGTPLPVDASLPNPNGFEFDNLYLDMNGIVHPCFHPERMVRPTTYEEVFEAMYKYIDRVFAVVRPRKLLFLAIDGVAPRAKMNQQRSRRFKAAKEAADPASDLVSSPSSESEEEEESLLPGSCGGRSPKSKGTGKDSGKEESPVLQPSMQMDSNVITPGTEFMQELSSALRYYINMRMDKNLAWRGVKVIVSDASVPGEGEHKIMSFIRLQRNLPGYDPNTRHCLFGLDADLIMLALVSHEVHFTILRGDVRMRKKERNRANKRFRELSIGKDVDKTVVAAALAEYIRKLKFKFINIWVLREYIALDMKPSVKVDTERLIDDFVLMCIFVGNDFLPNLRGLEISEGAINLLLIIYKKEFVQRGGYLTDSYKVNLERVEHLLESVGTHEHKILKKRKMCRRKLKKLMNLAANSCEIHDQSKFNNSSSKSIAPPVSQDLDCDLPAEVSKERFYFAKFGVQSEKDLKQLKKTAVSRYVEGILWVMRYYYDGICSWHWFYPYHYAPFASDFHPIHQLKTHFTLGEPFKPLDQLMAVLPAASAHALPPSYRELMTDTTSPIIDFYPTDFEIDMDGKRFEWQAIIKLPFIDESRLLAEIAKVEHTLTDDERRRNSMGLDLLFVHALHPLYGSVLSAYEKMNSKLNSTQTRSEHNLDPNLSDGMNGSFYLSAESVPADALPAEDMKTKDRNSVISVSYKCPSSHPHIPRPPKGVTIPKRCITPRDVMPLERLWRSSKVRMRAGAGRLLKFGGKLPGTDLRLKKKIKKNDYWENKMRLKDKAHKKDHSDRTARPIKLVRTGMSDKMESNAGANSCVMKLRSGFFYGASTIGTDRIQESVHKTIVKPAEGSLPRSDEIPVVPEKPKDSNTSSSLHLTDSATLNDQKSQERLERIREHVAAKGWELVVFDKSKKNKKKKNRKKQKVGFSVSIDMNERQDLQVPGEGSSMNLSGELQGKSESRNLPVEIQGSNLTTEDAKKTDLSGKMFAPNNSVERKHIAENNKVRKSVDMQKNDKEDSKLADQQGKKDDSLPKANVEVSCKKRKRKAKKTVSRSNSSSGPNETAAKVVLQEHKEEKGNHAKVVLDEHKLQVGGPKGVLTQVESRKRKRNSKKKNRRQEDAPNNGADMLLSSKTQPSN